MTRKTVNEVLPVPSVLGLRASFGFGDRLGLATPGHIQACLKGILAPIFVQQSVREMSRTNRTPQEVMHAAKTALRDAGWVLAWGADADHLQTREDVRRSTDAGFTLFTLDLSRFVNNEAENLCRSDLEKAVEELVTSGAFESMAEINSLYLNKSYDLGETGKISFDDREDLYRAVVKYGKAVAYAQQMAKWIWETATPRGAEIEVSVDETENPTSPREHLFVGLELKRRNVRVISLAPRFVGEFEKGIDYKGDLDLFEATLRQHVAIAQFCGPYKISFHSGSDKFRIYPIIGRVCGDLLHVKTAGTSYLVALRVVAHRDPGLFLDIIRLELERFDTDKVSYHITADPSRLRDPVSLDKTEREREYLNLEDGRQLLHVTFGSVLTVGKRENGQTFKDAILETLQTNHELYQRLLSDHLGHHIELLHQG